MMVSTGIRMNLTAALCALLALVGVGPSWGADDHEALGSAPINRIGMRITCCLVKYFYGYVHG